MVSAYAFDNLDFECHKHFQRIKYDDSYIGRKLNFLTVTGIEYDNNGKRMFRCSCDCGSEKLYDPCRFMKHLLLQRLQMVENGKRVVYENRQTDK